MIYIVTYEQPVYKDPGYYITSIDPDSTADFEEVLANSIFVPVVKPKVVSIEANIARNVLCNAGAKVTLC